MGAWLSSSSFVAALVATGAFFVALTLVSLASGYAVERRYWKLGRKIFDVPYKRTQARTELLGNVLFHLLWVPALAVTIASGALRFGSGVMLEVTTFFVCLYGFQAYYWFLHRAMHWRPLFFVHKWHHESLVTSPLTGFSMSPLEAVGWIVGFLAPALILSQLWAVGAWGYLGFLTFAWYGNIVGHANAELMPAFVSTKWGSMLYANPISYHSLHHARFEKHYGFGTAWMDMIFRTQWADWIAVSKRVRGGAPLTKLREKLDEV